MHSLSGATMPPASPVVKRNSTHIQRAHDGMYMIDEIGIDTVGVDPIGNVQIKDLPG